MSSSSDPEANLTFRTMEPTDLEIVLAWRSNPRVYAAFRKQTEPLSWADHLSWFGSRPKERHDYIICYNGRRVGSVNISPDSYVGVFIGETDLWGEGIGSVAIDWLCDEHDREAYFAEIHEDNTASRALFEGCGFTEIDRDDEWLLYRL